MDRSPVRDFIVGLFVLGGLAAIAYLSITIGGLTYAGPGGLRIYAAFDQTGGLKPRAPVVLSGVKVGQVESIGLDDAYRARVEMNLDPGLELPVDTAASIVTAGLLGDRYVSLQLGGEEDVLKSGDEIAFTESALLLERVIGQFIYGTTKDDEGGKAETGGAEETAPESSGEEER
ncbi:MAG: outer membrane lipid asymmetry maintenance protein MlaD [Candidatus Binatia bacterium]